MQRFRIIFRGLPPDETYRVVAYEGDAGLGTVVGKSAPFMGSPGETVPEVQVVCVSTGGIEGIILDADGRPIANAEIGCTAVFDIGVIAEPGPAFTNEGGSFVMLKLPQGLHSAITLTCERDGTTYRAIVENVEIVVDGVTNLGTVRLEPISAEEAEEVLGME